MRIVTIQKPVVDLKATGAKIKLLRIKSGFSVHDIQTIFGFEYPQAVYAWEQGKTSRQSTTCWCLLTCLMLQLKT